MTKEIEWEPEYNYKESPYVRPSSPWLKFWPDHIPKSIKFDPICVHDYVRLTAQKVPNNIAFTWVPKNKKYTYFY